MTHEGDYPFDTSAMSEILFDDIRNLSVHNGIFRCTLYSYRIIAGFDEPCWVPVQPLAMPIASVGPVAGKALAKVSIDSVTAARNFVADRVCGLMH